ncbi:2-nitropropane dioxygenase [Devosia epidermidihirudinis]|uniref:Nitronate monooxygenase n=1 Tax=Devosia epidermidihirudinis TaxID=1293439 RepID=A0A0F5Q8L1_9HYPH|nr:nitronate monooxygenase [Devosia epidermidihirudinis]KKC37275.1 2-nitropropane dioxygenase [Devosia epidermidihirudinis]
MTLLERIGIALPIIQAPMAGVSTPAMAASVSNAGALGSIGIGATDSDGARAMIAETRQLTGRAFNVNVFVHATELADPARETAWLDDLAPLFSAYQASPPTHLRTIYKSFADDRAMQDLLVDLAPPVVSFHFGLPDAAVISRLKDVGCVLLATATNLAEARAIEVAGIDAIVAQGYEAGGHRGMFDPHARDEQLGALALVRLLTDTTRLPVIAAGGLMDGRDIRAALDAGAVAAQLGTAFVLSPESSADAFYRAAMARADTTVMTTAISGRPARCVVNRFTAWGAQTRLVAPDYPRTYDAGKALNQAAKAAGEGGYGAQWSGTGVGRAEALPAAEIVARLAAQLNANSD